MEKLRNAALTLAQRIYEEAYNDAIREVVRSLGVDVATPKRRYGHGTGMVRDALRSLGTATTRQIVDATGLPYGTCANRLAQMSDVEKVARATWRLRAEAA